MSVLNKAVDRPILIVILFSIACIMGLFVMGDLAIDLFPNVTMPIISVNTTYTGSSPETVEKTVTKILESSLVNLSGLKKMTSTSSEGSSHISLEFNYGVDLDAATNDIRDKLSAVSDSLPDNATSPQISKFDTSSMPIMQLAVTGNRTPEELQKIGEDYLQDGLEQVAGVAKATVRGGRTAEVRIELSQNRLAAYGLTVSSLATALAAQNLELGGGSIKENGTAYLVRTDGGFSDIEAIASAVVATKNGYGVHLGELGTVTMGYADESSSVKINGKAGIYVSIQKTSGTNSVKTANALFKQLEILKKDLPKDVSVSVISDDTKTIKATISNLTESALEGAILAMVVIFIFLRTLKSTLIIGLSIPISIMITLLAMSMFGLTLNIMTMTGLILGVGMIVDASIINLENIYRYRERGTKSRMAAILGSAEMRAPIIASTLTHICVFLPMIIFKNSLGMIGQIFQDMIFTIVIALVSSLLVGMFLVPVLASKFLPLTPRSEKPIRNAVLRRLDETTEGLINGLVNAYGRGLALVLRHRLTTVLAVLIIFVGSLSLATNLRLVFTPETQDDSVSLSVSLPLGTTLAETKRIMAEFAAVAQNEMKGLDNIIVTSGSGDGGSTGNYTGSIKLTLPAFAKRIDSADAIKAKLRKHFSAYPGASFSFTQSRGRQLSGSSPIDITVRSNDYEAARATASSLLNLIKEQVPTALDPTLDLVDGLPQVEVAIDRNRAYALGLNINSIATEIQAAVAGKTATQFRKDGEQYDVVVLLQESDRSAVLDLSRIFVTGADGNPVSLSAFASLVKGKGPVTINRENKNRTIHLTANITSNTTSDAVQNQIKAVMAKSMIIEDRVHITWGGENADIQSTGMVFILILLMAILLVFSVMAAQYESFRDPIINICTIPFILIGVVLIYLISGQAVSMFSLVGLVMLIGIVVSNGIVFVDYTNLVHKRGLSVDEACVEAGKHRLRPILMTTLTLMLGTLPMALSSGDNTELIHPIGVTVIGGLLSSTLITLFFIPVMYSLLNRGRAAKIASRALMLKESQS